MVQPIPVGRVGDKSALTVKACRMDQLFAASTNVINAARQASEPFHTDAVRQEALAELRAAVKTFDRLNGGL